MLLSICIIVKEKDIVVNKCIEFIDDIHSLETDIEFIMVDNGISDEAKNEVCKRQYITYIPGNESAFDSSRNLYLEYAKGEYILVIDADERVLLKDISQIKYILRSKKSIAYRLPCYTYIGSGNWVEYKGIRLFQNKLGIHYDGKEMHGRLIDKEGNSLNKIAIDIFVPIHHFESYIYESLTDKRERNIKRLNAALNNDPNDYYSMMFLGLELASIGQYKEAERMWEKALIINGKSSFVKYFQMLFYYNSNRINEAYVIANELISRGKYLDISDMIRAEYFSYIGKKKDAITILENRILINSENPMLYLLLGIYYCGIDAYKSLANLYTAIDMNPYIEKAFIYKKISKESLYNIQKIRFFNENNIFSVLAKNYKDLNFKERFYYYENIDKDIKNGREPEKRFFNFI